jgi:hypothetical protein
MRTQRIVALALTASMFSGCFSARVTARGTPEFTESQTGFSLLWGITETKTQAVECEHGMQSVNTYFPWYWWLLTGVTVGIVTPIVKEYTCRAPTPAPAYPQQAYPQQQGYAPGVAPQGYPAPTPAPQR